VTEATVQQRPPHLPEMPRLPFPDDVVVPLSDGSITIDGRVVQHLDAFRVLAGRVAFIDKVRLVDHELVLMAHCIDPRDVPLSCLRSRKEFAFWVDAVNAGSQHGGPGLARRIFDPRHLKFEPCAWNFSSMAADFFADLERTMRAEVDDIIQLQ
jgi:hypothetical protein